MKKRRIYLALLAGTMTVSTATTIYYNYNKGGVSIVYANDDTTYLIPTEQNIQKVNVNVPKASANLRNTVIYIPNGYTQARDPQAATSGEFIFSVPERTTEALEAKYNFSLFIRYKDANNFFGLDFDFYKDIVNKDGNDGKAPLGLISKNNGKESWLNNVKFNNETTGKVEKYYLEWNTRYLVKFRTINNYSGTGKDYYWLSMTPEKNGSFDNANEQVIMNGSWEEVYKNAAHGEVYYDGKKLIDSSHYTGDANIGIRGSSYKDMTVLASEVNTYSVAKGYMEDCKQLILDLLAKNTVTEEDFATYDKKVAEFRAYMENFLDAEYSEKSNKGFQTKEAFEQMAKGLDLLEDYMKIRSELKEGDAIEVLKEVKNNYLTHATSTTNPIENPKSAQIKDAYILINENIVEKELNRLLSQYGHTQEGIDIAKDLLDAVAISPELKEKLRLIEEALKDEKNAVDSIKPLYDAYRQSLISNDGTVATTKKALEDKLAELEAKHRKYISDKILPKNDVLEKEIKQFKYHKTAVDTLKNYVDAYNELKAVYFDVQTNANANNAPYLNIKSNYTEEQVKEAIKNKLAEVKANNTALIEASTKVDNESQVARREILYANDFGTYLFDLLKYEYRPSVKYLFDLNYKIEESTKLEKDPEKTDVNSVTDYDLIKAKYIPAYKEAKLTPYIENNNEIEKIVYTVFEDFIFNTREKENDFNTKVDNFYIRSIKEDIKAFLSTGIGKEYHDALIKYNDLLEKTKANTNTENIKAFEEAIKNLASLTARATEIESAAIQYGIPIPELINQSQNFVKVQNIELQLFKAGNNIDSITDDELDALKASLSGVVDDISQFINPKHVYYSAQKLSDRISAYVDYIKALKKTKADPSEANIAELDAQKASFEKAVTQSDRNNDSLALEYQKIKEYQAGRAAVEQAKADVVELRKALVAKKKDAETKPLYDKLIEDIKKVNEIAERNKNNPLFEQSYKINVTANDTLDNTLAMEVRQINYHQKLMTNLKQYVDKYNEIIDTYFDVNQPTKVDDNNTTTSTFLNLKQGKTYEEVEKAIKDGFATLDTELTNNSPENTFPVDNPIDGFVGAFEHPYIEKFAKALRVELTNLYAPTRNNFEKLSELKKEYDALEAKYKEYLDDTVYNFMGQDCKDVNTLYVDELKTFIDQTTVNNQLFNKNRSIIGAYLNMPTQERYDELVKLIEAFPINYLKDKFAPIKAEIEKQNGLKDKVAKLRELEKALDAGYDQAKVDEYNALVAELSSNDTGSIKDTIKNLLSDTFNDLGDFPNNNFKTYQDKRIKLADLSKKVADISNLGEAEVTAFNNKVTEFENFINTYEKDVVPTLNEYSSLSVPWVDANTVDMLKKQLEVIKALKAANDNLNDNTLAAVKQAMDAYKAVNSTGNKDLDKKYQELIDENAANKWKADNQDIISKNKEDVTNTQENKEAVNKALTEYDALTPAQKALVENEKNNLIEKLVNIAEDANSNAIDADTITIAKSRVATVQDPTLKEKLDKIIDVLEKVNAFRTAKSNLLSLTDATVTKDNIIDLEAAIAEIDAMETNDPQVKAKLAKEREKLSNLLKVAKAKKEAEEKVTLAETNNKIAVDEQSYTDAKNVVDALPDSPEKTALLQRLALIDEVNTFRKTEKTNIDKTEATAVSGDIDAISASIDKYNNLSEKAKEILAPEKAKLDTAKNAAEVKKAVEDAISATVDEKLAKIAEAKKKVETLADTAVKTELNAQLDAEEFKTVHKDILSKDYSNITNDANTENALKAANDAYNALSQEAKAKLTAEKKKLDELNAALAVLKADKANADVVDDTTIATAQGLVDLLEANSIEKTALQAKLDVLNKVNEFRTEFADLLAKNPADLTEDDKAKLDEANKKLLTLPKEVTDKLAKEIYKLKEFDAEVAVREAEAQNVTTTEQTSITGAQSAIDKLNDGDYKNTLKDRVQAVIDANTFRDDLNTVAMMGKTSETIAESDLTALEKAIEDYNKLSKAAQDRCTKEIEHLKSLKLTLEAKKAAREKLEAAEKANKDVIEPTSIEEAEKLIKALPENSAEKTAYKERLQAIKDANTFRADNKDLLEKTEAQITSADLDNINAQLEKLNKDSSESGKLSDAAIDKLAKEKEILETLKKAAEAKKAVEDIDTAGTKAEKEAAIEKARDAVAKVVDSTVKADLTSDINKKEFVNNNSDILSKSPSEVTTDTKAQIEKDLAKAKSDYANLDADTKAKTSQEKQKIDELSATLAVVKAEDANATAVDTNSIAAARSEVNALPEGELKKELTKRLDILDKVNTFRNDKSTLLNLNDATVTKNDISALEEAIKEIEAMKDTEPEVYAKLANEKAKLESLLSVAKSKNGAEEKVALAERNNATVVDEDSVQAARDAVNALPNSDEKTALSKRLDLLDEVNAFRKSEKDNIDKTEVSVSSSDIDTINKSLEKLDTLSKEAQAILAPEKAKLEKAKNAAEVKKAVEDALVSTADNYVENIKNAREKVETLEDEELKKELKAKLDAYEFKMNNADILAKTVDTITNDKAIETALAKANEDYKLLSEDAKKNLTAEKQRLDELNAALAVLKAEDANASVIDSDSITNAEDLVNVLGNDNPEKAKLQDKIDVLKKVNAYREKYADLLAKDPSALTDDDKVTLEAAKTEFDGLDEAVKAKLGAEKNKLTNFDAEYAVRNAEKENKDITNTTSIDAAKETVGKVVDKDLSDKLNARIKAVEDANTFRDTQNTKDMMAKTPITVAESDLSNVEKAIEQYNALSPEAQARCAKEIEHLKELKATIEAKKDAREKLEAAEKANATAIEPESIAAAEKLIEALPENSAEKAEYEERLQAIKDANTFRTENADLLAKTEAEITSADLDNINVQLDRLDANSTSTDKLTEKAAAKLAEEKATLEKLKKAAEAKKAVEAIEKADTVEAKKEAIEKAREAIAKVEDEAVKADLTAEVNRKEFANNNSEILAKEVADVNTATKEDIEKALEKAKQEYEALDEASKAKATEEKKKLDELSAALAVVKAEDANKDAEDAASIEEARKLIDSLPDDNPNKELLSNRLDNIDGANEFRDKYKELLAKDPSALTEEDKATLDQAKSELEKLPEDIKSKLGTEKDKLTNFDAEYAVRNAEKSNETVTEQTSITEAKEAVAKVKDETLKKKFEDRTQAVEDANTFRDTQNTKDMMAKTAATVAESDLTNVEKAIAQYEALSLEAQARCVKEIEHLKELKATIEAKKDAREKLEAAEKANEKAIETTSIATAEKLIEALPENSAEKAEYEERLQAIKDANTFRTENKDLLAKTEAEITSADLDNINAQLDRLDANSTSIDKLTEKATAKLAEEKATLEKLKKAAEAKKAVEAIEKADTVEAKKEAIDKAREAIAKVEDEAVKADLTAKADALEFANNNDVILKTEIADINTDNKKDLQDKVNKALADYNNLSKEAKDYAKDEKRKLDELNAALAVQNAKDANVKYHDDKSINVAKAMVDLLEDGEVKEALLEALANIDKANAFKIKHDDAINKPVNWVESSDIDAINRALEEYEQLDEETKSRLQVEKEKLDERLAIAKAVAATENAENLKTDEAIAEALKLIDEVKDEKVKAALLERIEVLKAVAKYLNDNKEILAKTIETVDLEDKALIEKAIEEYKNLTPRGAKDKLAKERRLLEEMLNKLNELEAEEERIKAEIEKYKEDHKEVLDLTVDNVAEENRKAIESAMIDYEGLSDAAKNRLIDEKNHLNDLLTELDIKANDDKLAEDRAEKFRKDHYNILRKDEVTVTLADEQSILKALNEYETLPDDVKEKLSKEKEILDMLKKRIEELKKAELDKAKKDAINELDNINGLTDEEKTAAIDKINACETVADVIITLNEVKASKANDDEKALLEKKNQAIEEVNALKNLNDKQKSDYINRIINADTENAIDDIVQKAKEKDSEILEKAKAEVSDIINKLQNISEEEKEAYINSLTEIDNVIDVYKVLNDAVNKDAQELKIAKEEAIKEVNALYDITLEDKKEFRDKILNATTKEEIAAIVEEAKKLNAENLEREREIARDIINNLANLYDTEKAEFIGEIDAVENSGQIDEIIKRAKDKAHANLLDKKAEAEKEINDLIDLSQAEKDEFNSRIEDATTIEEVERILEEAKAKSEVNAEDKREQMKEEIKKLQNLTDKEKADFIDAIDKAVDTDAANKILEDAKAKDRDALNAKKVEAIKEISDMKHLSEKDRVKFINEINLSNTIKEIDAILERARKLNDKLRNAMPNTGVGGLGSLFGLLSSITGLGILKRRKKDKKK